MTQKERVKEHLEKYNTITSWQAFDRYGITRLASCIWSLRAEGLRIDTNFKTAKNRYGDSTSYAEYTLVNNG